MTHYSSGHHSNEVENISRQITVVGLPIRLISLKRGRLNLFCQIMLKWKQLCSRWPERHICKSHRQNATTRKRQTIHL